ncbi:hypothetical protein [Halomonas sp. BC04]|uniref:hypothetical protein n=1 Tax=Halomonas sp. BC04 TaxID=1403540 RepID=UPI0003ED76E9|nr:hypothetical protein [Halomonas sp. BC04]EWH03233.1 hypothetical protein Q427_04570 [Halomonas sp. BC04]
MLIDEALHEARRLQASLRAMNVDQAALDEADLLCRALQHDPVENVVPFALDALERVDSHLPSGTLAGLVRVRIRSLVGTLQTLSERRDRTEITHGAVLTKQALQQAASNGVGAGCLSPSQAWAAWKLAIPVERLQRPLPARVVAVLDRVSRFENPGKDLIGEARPIAR